MNIREELKQLRERIDQLEQQLEPEITEGQYFERAGAIYRVMYIFDGTVYPYHVKRVAGDRDMPEVDDYDDSILAYGILSDDEVEQALVKEAKRRGFGDGVKIKQPSTSKNNPGEAGIIEGAGIHRLSELDNLSMGGVTVYMEGEFAEIIEDEWEVRQYPRRDDFYVTDGEGKIDRSYNKLSKKQAHAIKKALNNLNND